LKYVDGTGANFQAGKNGNAVWRAGPEMGARL
jgi:hypothetical protein